MPKVNGFDCRRVEDSQTLESFGRTFAQANDLPDTNFWESPDLLETPNWDLFLGRLNGEPVATGLGYTSGGITGLWGIATLPDFRGRGLGSAITWAAVHAGKRWGSRATYLWATEMGFPVYLKMGFRHVENKAIWIFQQPT